MKRRASTAILIVYWLALPFLALALLTVGPVLGSGLRASGPPFGPIEWLALAAIPVLTLLVVWRIRLHLKARARSVGSVDQNRTDD